MGYYQAGDRGDWYRGNYYAGGDPGFFGSLWSGIKAAGRIIAPVVATVAPIVGAIGAPFTGGASLGLGAAIGAGARLLGGAVDDPTPSGSPLENTFSAENPPVSPGYRIGPTQGGWGSGWGASPPVVRPPSSAPMRTPPPQFGQDYSDYSYTDADYDFEEEDFT